MHEEVKITRKYQVTIPASVRSKLGVKVGDKLIVKSEGKRLIMETHEHVDNPSDVLWNLFGKPIGIDATKLVEDSWKETCSSEPKKPRTKKQNETTA